MKTMLQKFSKLVVLSLVILTISSMAFGETMDVGDVVMEYGFETDQPIEDLDLIERNYWGYNDYAPDSVFWQGDTLIKGVDFFSYDIDSATIASDDYHTGSYSLFLANVCDTISAKTVVSIGLPDTLIMGAAYTFEFWSKYEISEGNADFRLGVGDDAINNTWTGLSDGWEKIELEATWMGLPEIAFGLNGKGKVYIDDLKITQVEEAYTEIKNGNFEIADPEDPENLPLYWFHHVEGGWTSADEYYTYQSDGGYNNSACIGMQYTELDTNKWHAVSWQQNFPFINNHAYKMIWKVKTKNMTKDMFAAINLGFNNENTCKISMGDGNVDEYGCTDGWITVADTFEFPFVANSNGWRNQLRVQLRGYASTSLDSMPEILIDDIEIVDVGPLPTPITEYTVTKNEDGTYNISFDAQPGITYSLTKEPLEWTEEENILPNPYFEDADTTGNIAFWEKDDRGANNLNDFDAAYMEWLTPDYEQGIDGSGCVYISSDEGEKGVCAAWKQWSLADRLPIDYSQIFLYRTMARYEDIRLGVDRSWKITGDDWADEIIAADPTPEDSINIAGVFIYPRYYTDAFHIAGQYNPAAYGYEKKYGTSDGWEEQSYPLPPMGISWPRHYIGLGMGHDWGAAVNLPVLGDVFFDNAGIIPFQELMNDITTGTITNLEVPEGTRWLGITGKDAVGFQANATVIYIDTAKVVETSVDDVNVARKFKLEQNYPNPFNPTTQISYYIPNHEVVNLYIYDMLGREVTKLVNNKPMTAGMHDVQFDASNLASGIYFYKIKAGNHISIKKMMLLK